VKSTDPLFLLIKSLTFSEKGYFKKYYASEGSNFFKLFDALNAQDEYDDEKLLKKFKGQSFIKNFSVAKSYLYDAVLRALRQYHSGKSVDAQVHEDTENLRILFHKHLYPQFEKLLRVTKILCYRCEMFEELLPILNLENLYNIQLALDLQPVNTERTSVLNKLNNANEYNHVYSNVYDFIKLNDQWQDKGNVDKLNEIMKHPLFYDDGNAFTLRAKNIISKYLVTVSSCNGKFQESLCT